MAQTTGLSLLILKKEGTGRIWPCQAWWTQQWYTHTVFSIFYQWYPLPVDYMQHWKFKKVCCRMSCLPSVTFQHFAVASLFSFMHQWVMKMNP